MIKSMSIFDEKAVGVFCGPAKLEYNSYSCVGQWKLTLPTPIMMKSDNGILSPKLQIKIIIRVVISMSVAGQLIRAPLLILSVKIVTQ